MNQYDSPVETHFTLKPKTGSASGIFRAEKALAGPQGRPPRIARMMALAIHLQGLIDTGKVKNFTTLAHAGYVSRARITQIMDLNMLAPDIQEEILFLPEITKGREILNERMLRSVARHSFWGKQRDLWKALRAGVR